MKASINRYSAPINIPVSCYCQYCGASLDVLIHYEQSSQLREKEIKISVEPCEQCMKVLNALKSGGITIKMGGKNEP